MRSTNGIRLPRAESREPLELPHNIPEAEVRPNAEPHHHRYATQRESCYRAKKSPDIAAEGEVRAKPHQETTDATLPQFPHRWNSNSELPTEQGGRQCAHEQTQV